MIFCAPEKEVTLYLLRVMPVFIDPFEKMGRIMAWRFPSIFVRPISFTLLKILIPNFVEYSPAHDIVPAIKGGNSVSSF